MNKVICVERLAWQLLLHGKGRRGMPLQGQARPPSGAQHNGPRIVGPTVRHLSDRATLPILKGENPKITVKIQTQKPRDYNTNNEISRHDFY